MRRSSRKIEQRFRSAVWVRWHQNPVARSLLPECLFQFSIVRFANCRQAECLGQIVFRKGEEPFSVVTHDQRFVIDEDGQGERKGVRDDENRKRIVATFYSPELLDAFSKDRNGPRRTD